MADRRVVVTGLGVVTAAGIGADTLWQALLDKRSAVREIDLFDASTFPSRIAGQLDDFSAKKFVPKSYRKSVKVMARDIEIAVAAADLAFADAGIVTAAAEDATQDVPPDRLGCNIGAGLICSDLNELGLAVNTAVEDGKFSLRAWGREGMNNLTPLWLLKYLPNMLACHVTIIHQACGPSNCITCESASAHLATGESARIIERGDADVVIAGGAESKLNPMGLLRQTLLKRLSAAGNDDPAAAVRPFDAAHDGTALGEGGGLIILEDLQRARERGATIYAELVGFGAACDPQGIDVERPNAGGLDLAIGKALADAGISADDVDCVLAHGTGVPAEDAAETAAWTRALGDRAGDIPAAAVTGTIGSLFAGAGGAELAAACMCLREQTVPPTVNHESPAEDGALIFLSHPESANIEYLVTGAFATGGQSAAAVLKRYEA